MRFRRRSLLRFLVLACYTLSLTVGGWFHDHHHGSPCNEAGHPCAFHAWHGAASPERSPGCLQGDHARLAARAVGADRHSHQDRVCLVCRFLSQRPVESGRVVEITSAPRAEHVTWLAPPLIARAPVACCQIRAPPPVA